MVSVNDTCIGCGTCAAIAPEFFRVDSVPAVVIKQPETPEGQQQCDDAKSACPVAAIE